MGAARRPLTNQILLIGGTWMVRDWQAAPGCRRAVDKSVIEKGLSAQNRPSGRPYQHNACRKQGW